MVMKRLIRRAALGGSVMLFAVAAGCASRVTLDNYERIENGMSRSDVVGILGEGKRDKGVGGAFAEFSGSARVMTWKDGDKSVIVTFLNDKVVTKVQKGL